MDGGSEAASMSEPWKPSGKTVVVKTPADWMAEAQGSNGWICPKCGCRDLRVKKTSESASGDIVRTRYCRNCGPNGPRIYTTETPYKVAGGDDADK